VNCRRKYWYNATVMNRDSPSAHVGRVERIVNGGWGILRRADGVVFLTGVLPQERVRYRVRERSRGVLWGELLEVEEPSPDRREPPCSHFGHCGGCTFQHMAFPRQLGIKKEIFAEDFRRIAGIEMGGLESVSSPPFAYRVRARFKAAPGGRIGFVRKGTTRVLPLDRCLLVVDEINEFLGRWNARERPPFFHQLDVLWNPTRRKTWVHLSPPPGPRALDFLRGFDGVGFIWKGCGDEGVSSMTAGRHEYSVSPAVFFQVNRFMWAALQTEVDSHLRPVNSALDLYSGVGFFLPSLLARARRVTAVEQEGQAVELLRRRFPSVSTIVSPLEKCTLPRVDVAIVDPPRSGLSQRVLREIAARRIPRLIYVSCASATLARDVAWLGGRGYKLQGVRTLDQFPQTPHLESVSLLEL